MNASTASSDFSLSFGAALKDARKRAGLSQQELAEKLGVSRNTVVNWEAGRNRPDVRAASALCRVLDVSASLLFAEGRPRTSAGVSRDAASLSEEEHGLLRQFRKLSPGGKTMALRLVGDILDAEEQERFRRLKEGFLLLARFDSPVAAGPGAEFGEARPSPVFLRRSARTAGADALVRVSGDSMEPVYHDGDLLCFRYAQSAAPGTDAVCATARGAVVKRVDRDGGLFSVNPARPFTMTSEGDGVRVLGVVTGAVGAEDAAEAEEEESLRDIFREDLEAFRRRYGLQEWEG